VCVECEYRTTTNNITFAHDKFHGNSVSCAVYQPLWLTAFLGFTDWNPCTVKCTFWIYIYIYQLKWNIHFSDVGQPIICSEHRSVLWIYLKMIYLVWNKCGLLLDIISATIHNTSVCVCCPQQLCQIHVTLIWSLHATVWSILIQLSLCKCSCCCCSSDDMWDCNRLHPTVTSCYSGCNILLSSLEICSIQPYSMSVYPVSLIYRHRWHFPRTCVWEWYLHYHVHHNWYIHSESVNYNIHNECKCMCDVQYCWLVLLLLCVCFTFAHSARYVYYNILNNHHARKSVYHALYISHLISS